MEGGGVALTRLRTGTMRNVYRGCRPITMARRNAVVQAFQFDPESDPDAPEDGEASEGAASQRLQQDVSGWLVLNIVSRYGTLVCMFMYAVTVLSCS